MPYSYVMDLKQVIAELRAELESIDQVMVALEKLAELRSRRGSALTHAEAEAAPPPRRTRARKPTPPQETAAAASSD